MSQLFQDPAPDSLDPADWATLRHQAHGMLDDMLDHLEHLRQHAVWQAAPDEVRARFAEPLPRQPGSLDSIHARFMNDILPYGVGNIHPGFMGWVHGGGTLAGMLAEMLAAGMNANLGGRNQIPVQVEWQIVRWMRELFDFPAEASGVFVTGTSQANLMAVWVARVRYLGVAVRRQGLAQHPLRLRAYASTAAHGSVAQALDLAGLGSDCLCRIDVDAAQRIDVDALRRQIEADRQAGWTPFLLVGNAGTVDCGAIDPLDDLADIAQAHGVWLHVDGALGALGMLNAQLAPLFAGITRADSIAFDFHKWGQVPYDAGFVLVRDGELHLGTFASPAAYLRREADGLAGGSPWPCDFGPDLSRGFRALKTWFTLQVYGTDRLGQIMAQTCALARYLAERITAEPMLELRAPVALNIVCFTYRCDAAEAADAVNAAIAVAVQHSGLAAPSTTVLEGHLVLRAAIVNHRTRAEDIDRLVDAVLQQGARLAGATRD